MSIISKIKAFFTVKSSFEQIVREAKMESPVGKPAWKTTEFYFNLAGQIGVMWGAVSGFIPPQYAAIISTVGIAIYTIARTISKAVTDVQNATVVTGGSSATAPSAAAVVNVK